MTRDQKQILHILNANGGTVTTEQVAAAIGTTARNGGKYISERLSCMVKQGILKRVKPGVFQIGDGKRRLTPGKRIKPTDVQIVD